MYLFVFNGFTSRMILTFGYSILINRYLSLMLINALSLLLFIFITYVILYIKSNLIQNIFSYFYEVVIIMRITYLYKAPIILSKFFLNNIQVKVIYILYIVKLKKITIHNERTNYILSVSI